MKLVFSILASMLLISNFACSSLPDVDSTPAAEIRPIEAERKHDLTNLKKQIKNGKPEENINRLSSERVNYKGTEFEPELEQLLANEYLRAGKLADAGFSFLRSARSSNSAEKRGKLCQSSVRAYESAQDWEAMKKTIDYCVMNIQISPESSRELKLLRLTALEKQQAPVLEITKANIELMANSQGEAELKYRTNALQLMETMNADQLNQVINDSEFGSLRGHAAFRLGQMHMAQRNNDSAETAFAKVAQFLPETDLAEQAQKRIESIKMASYVNPSTVGVVLPLSGKHAAMGEKVLRGLQMGLGLDGEGITPIRLAVVDSEGNPDLARKGVERLVQEDNVIAIAGSLLSKTASAVADQAQVMGVPNIGLSQKSGLTDVGENIFRFGMTSEMQVRFLVRKCMKELGMRRFAIIYPNDKFGVEYANIFWDEVLARGGEIRAAQSYDPDDIDFSGPVQRLVGTFYQEERQDEVRSNLKLQQERRKGMGTRARIDDDILSPVVDFDAVFIPDGLKALGQISAMLSFSGVRGVKLIGPSLWNNTGIGKRLGNTGNQILFVDGAPLDFKSTMGQNFVKKYQSFFKEEPGVFEVQGYETGLLLNRVLAENVRTRSDFRNALQNLKPVKGLINTIYMGSEREFGKQLYLYTLENNQIKLLN